MNDPNAPEPADADVFRVAGRSFLSGLRESAAVRVVADAGTARDARSAMKPGRVPVSMHTAFAEARNPSQMAAATCKVVEVGRMPRSACAPASSPIDGTFFS